MESQNCNHGAVQFGNFNNYYQFNLPKERLKVLNGHNEHWLPSVKEEDVDHKNNIKATEHCSKYYLILDVGCNSGNLTEELYQYCKEIIPDHDIRILAIDCDACLVERAREKNQNLQEISYECINIMHSEDRKKIWKYLNKYNQTRFNAVCCFSITMWIHLNYHEKGLQEFLKLMSDLSELLILEPQSWKCYRTAQHRMLKAGRQFTFFPHLKWRSDVEKEIDNYVTCILERKKIYRSDETKWRRSITFYR